MSWKSLYGIGVTDLGTQQTDGDFSKMSVNDLKQSKVLQSLKDEGNEDGLDEAFETAYKSILGEVADTYKNDELMAYGSRVEGELANLYKEYSGKEEEGAFHEMLRARRTVGGNLGLGEDIATNGARRDFMKVFEEHLEGTNSLLETSANRDKSGYFQFGSNFEEAADKEDLWGAGFLNEENYKTMHGQDFIRRTKAKRLVTLMDAYADKDFNGATEDGYSQRDVILAQRLMEEAKKSGVADSDKAASRMVANALREQAENIEVPEYGILTSLGFGKNEASGEDPVLSTLTKLKTQEDIDAVIESMPDDIPSHSKWQLAKGLTHYRLNRFNIAKRQEELSKAEAGSDLRGLKYIGRAAYVLPDIYGEHDGVIANKIEKLEELKGSPLTEEEYIAGVANYLTERKNAGIISDTWDLGANVFNGAVGAIEDLQLGVGAMMGSEAALSASTQKSNESAMVKEFQEAFQISSMRSFGLEAGAVVGELAPDVAIALTTAGAGNAASLTAKTLAKEGLRQARKNATDIATDVGVKLARKNYKKALSLAKTSRHVGPLASGLFATGSSYGATIGDHYEKFKSAGMSHEEAFLNARLSSVLPSVTEGISSYLINGIVSRTPLSGKGSMDRLTMGDIAQIDEIYEGGAKAGGGWKKFLKDLDTDEVPEKLGAFLQHIDSGVTGGFLKTLKKSKAVRGEFTKRLLNPAIGEGFEEGMSEGLGSILGAISISELGGHGAITVDELLESIAYGALLGATAGGVINTPMQIVQGVHSIRSYKKRGVPVEIPEAPNKPTETPSETPSPQSGNSTPSDTQAASGADEADAAALFSNANKKKAKFLQVADEDAAPNATVEDRHPIFGHGKWPESELGGTINTPSLQTSVASLDIDDLSKQFNAPIVSVDDVGTDGGLKKFSYVASYDTKYEASSKLTNQKVVVTVSPLRDGKFEVESSTVEPLTEDEITDLKLNPKDLYSSKTAASNTKITKVNKEDAAHRNTNLYRFNLFKGSKLNRKDKEGNSTMAGEVYEELRKLRNDSIPHIKEHNAKDEPVFDKKATYLSRDEALAELSKIEKYNKSNVSQSEQEELEFISNGLRKRLALFHEKNGVDRNKLFNDKDLEAVNAQYIGKSTAETDRLEKARAENNRKRKEDVKPSATKKTSGEENKKESTSEEAPKSKVIDDDDDIDYSPPQRSKKADNDADNGGNKPDSGKEAPTKSESSKPKTTGSPPKGASVAKTQDVTSEKDLDQSKLEELFNEVESTRRYIDSLAETNKDTKTFGKNASRLLAHAWTLALTGGNDAVDFTAVFNSPESEEDVIAKHGMTHVLRKLGRDNHISINIPKLAVHIDELLSEGYNISPQEVLRFIQHGQSLKGNEGSVLNVKLVRGSVKDSDVLGMVKILEDGTEEELIWFQDTPSNPRIGTWMSMKGSDYKAYMDAYSDDDIKDDILGYANRMLGKTEDGKGFNNKVTVSHDPFTSAAQVAYDFPEARVVTIDGKTFELDPQMDLEAFKAMLRNDQSMSDTSSDNFDDTAAIAFNDGELAYVPKIDLQINVDGLLERASKLSDPTGYIKAVIQEEVAHVASVSAFLTANGINKGQFHADLLEIGKTVVKNEANKTEFAARYSSIDLTDLSESNLRVIGMEWIAMAAQVSLTGKSTIDFMDKGPFKDTVEDLKRDTGLLSRITDYVRSMIAAAKNALKMRRLIAPDEKTRDLVTDVITLMGSWNIENLGASLDFAFKLDEAAKLDRDAKVSLLSAKFDPNRDKNINPFTNLEYTEEELRRQQVLEQYADGYKYGLSMFRAKGVETIADGMKVITDTINYRILHAMSQEEEEKRKLIQEQLKLSRYSDAEEGTQDYRDASAMRDRIKEYKTRSEKDKVFMPEEDVKEIKKTQMKVIRGIGAYKAEQILESIYAPEVLNEAGDNPTSSRLAELFTINTRIPHESDYRRMLEKAEFTSAVVDEMADRYEFGRIVSSNEINTAVDKNDLKAGITDYQASLLTSQIKALDSYLDHIEFNMPPSNLEPFNKEIDMVNEIGEAYSVETIPHLRDQLIVAQNKINVLHQALPEDPNEASDVAYKYTQAFGKVREAIDLRNATIKAVANKVRNSYRYGRQGRSVRESEAISGVSLIRNAEANAFYSRVANLSYIEFKAKFPAMKGKVKIKAEHDNLVPILDAYDNEVVDYIDEGEEAFQVYAQKIRDAGDNYKDITLKGDWQDGQLWDFPTLMNFAQMSDPNFASTEGYAHSELFGKFKMELGATPMTEALRYTSEIRAREAGKDGVGSDTKFRKLFMHVYKTGRAALLAGMADSQRGNDPAVVYTDEEIMSAGWDRVKNKHLMRGEYDKGSSDGSVIEIENYNDLTKKTYSSGDRETDLGMVDLYEQWQQRPKYNRVYPETNTFLAFIAHGEDYNKTLSWLSEQTPETFEGNLHLLIGRKLEDELQINLNNKSKVEFIRSELSLKNSIPESNELYKILSSESGAASKMWKLAQGGEEAIDGATQLNKAQKDRLKRLLDQITDIDNTAIIGDAISRNAVHVKDAVDVFAAGSLSANTSTPDVFSGVFPANMPVVVYNQEKLSQKLLEAGDFGGLVSQPQGAQTENFWQSGPIYSKNSDSKDGGRMIAYLLNDNELEESEVGSDFYSRTVAKMAPVALEELKSSSSTPSGIRDGLNEMGNILGKLFNIKDIINSYSDLKTEITDVGRNPAIEAFQTNAQLLSLKTDLDRLIFKQSKVTGTNPDGSPFIEERLSPRGNASYALVKFARLAAQARSAFNKNTDSTIDKSPEARSGVYGRKPSFYNQLNKFLFGKFNPNEKKLEDRIFGHLKDESKLSPDDIRSLRKFLKGLVRVSKGEPAIMYETLQVAAAMVKNRIGDKPMSRSEFNREFDNLFSGAGWFRKMQKHLGESKFNERYANDPQYAIIDQFEAAGIPVQFVDPNFAKRLISEIKGQNELTSFEKGVAQGSGKKIRPDKKLIDYINRGIAASDLNYSVSAERFTSVGNDTLGVSSRSKEINITPTKKKSVPALAKQFGRDPELAEELEEKFGKQQNRVNAIIDVEGEKLGPFYISEGTQTDAKKKDLIQAILEIDEKAQRIRLVTPTLLKNKRSGRPTKLAQVEDVDKMFLSVSQSTFVKDVTAYYGITVEEASVLKSQLVADNLFKKRKVLIPPKDVFDVVGAMLSPYEILQLANNLKNYAQPIPVALGKPINPLEDTYPMEGVFDVLKDPSLAPILAKTPAYKKLRGAAIEAGIIPDNVDLQDPEKGNAILRESVPPRVWKLYMASVYSRTASLTDPRIEDETNQMEDDDDVIVDPEERLAVALGDSIDLEKEPTLEFLMVVDYAISQKTTRQYEGVKIPEPVDMKDVVAQRKKFKANQTGLTKKDNVDDPDHVKVVTMSDLFNRGEKVDGMHFPTFDHPILMKRVMFREFQPLKMRFMHNRIAGAPTMEVQEKVKQKYPNEWARFVKAAQDEDYLTAFDILVEEGVTFVQDLLEENMNIIDSRDSSYKLKQILKQEKQAALINNFAEVSGVTTEGLHQYQAKIESYSDEQLDGEMLLYGVTAKTLKTRNATQVRSSLVASQKRAIARETLQAFRVAQKKKTLGVFKDNEIIKVIEEATNETTEAFEDWPETKEAIGARTRAKVRKHVLDTHYKHVPSRPRRTRPQEKTITRLNAELFEALWINPEKKWETLTAYPRPILDKHIKDIRAELAKSDESMSAAEIIKEAKARMDAYHNRDLMNSRERALENGVKIIEEAIFNSGLGKTEADKLDPRQMARDRMNFLYSKRQYIAKETAKMEAAQDKETALDYKQRLEAGLLGVYNKRYSLSQEIPQPLPLILQTDNPSKKGKFEFRSDVDWEIERDPELEKAEAIGPRAVEALMQKRKKQQAKFEKERAAEYDPIKEATFNADEEIKNFGLPTVTMAGLRVVLNRKQLILKHLFKLKYTGIPSYNLFSGGSKSKQTMNAMLNLQALIMDTGDDEAKASVVNADKNMVNDRAYAFMDEMNVALAYYTKNSYDSMLAGKNPAEYITKINTGLSSNVDHISARIRRAFPRIKQASQHMKRIISMFKTGLDGNSGIFEYQSDTKRFREKWRRFNQDRDTSKDGLVLGVMQAFSFVNTPNKDDETFSFHDQLSAYMRVLNSSIKYYENLSKRAVDTTGKKDKRLNKHAFEKWEAEKENYKTLLEVKDTVIKLGIQVERKSGKAFTSNDPKDIFNAGLAASSIITEHFKSETDDPSNEEVFMDFMRKNFSQQGRDYHASKLIAGSGPKTLRHVHGFVPIAIHEQEDNEPISNLFKGMQPSDYLYTSFEPKEMPDLLINLNPQDLIPRSYSNISYAKNVGPTLSMFSKMYSSKKDIKPDDWEDTKVRKGHVAATKQVVIDKSANEIHKVEEVGQFVTLLVEELNNHFKHERNPDSKIDKVMGAASKVMYVRGLVSFWMPISQYVAPMLTYSFKRLMTGDTATAKAVFKQSMELVIGSASYYKKMKGDGTTEEKVSQLTGAAKRFHQTQDNLKRFVPELAYRALDGNSFVKESDFKMSDYHVKGLGYVEGGKQISKATIGVVSKMYDHMGDWSVGVADRNAIIATFVAEYERLTGRKFHKENPSTVDIDAVAQAQENAENESSVSASYMKGKWLKNTHGNIGLKNISGNLLKRALFIFSSHVTSIYSSARAANTEYRHRDDLKGKRLKITDADTREAAMEIIGPIVQTLLFNLSKPKLLVPVMVLLYSIFSGDDEEEQKEIVKEFYTLFRGDDEIDSGDPDSARIWRVLRSFIDPGGKPISGKKALGQIGAAAFVDSIAVGMGFNSAGSALGGIASASQIQQGIGSVGTDTLVGLGLRDPDNQYGSFVSNTAKAIFGAPAIVAADVLDSTVRPYTLGRSNAGIGATDLANLITQILPVTREMRNTATKEVMSKQQTPWFDKYGRASKKKVEADPLDD